MSGSVAQRDAAPAPDRTVISSAYLHRLQRRHFILYDVLPMAGTAIAVALFFVRQPRVIDAALLGVMWLLTGLGLSVGYHRLFAHRAFATTAPVAAALLIFGAMAARGPMVSWVAIHRRHHQHSDRPGDMHSPNLHRVAGSGWIAGWLHAHLTWMIRHDYPNPRHYVPDLFAQPQLLRLNRHYEWCVGLGLALPTIIGALAGDGLTGALYGFLWGGVVRIFLVEHSMSAVNSWLHLHGARPFPATADNSRNSAWLGLLVWGEGWHNNHHAHPYSAAFGLRWYQLDPGYWLIRLLRAVGLAWNVKLAEGKPAAAAAE